MKLYLDTDIIYGFFKEVVKSWDEHRKVNSPSVIRFLKANEKDMSFFISEIVYFELIKRIKYEYKLSEEKIEKLIRYFEKTLNIIVVSRGGWFNERLFDEIFGLIKRESFKIGLADILHAYIAKQNNLTLFTGDNASLNEDARKICEHVIDYSQLRKKFK